MKTNHEKDWPTPFWKELACDLPVAMHHVQCGELLVKGNCDKEGWSGFKICLP